MLYTHIGGKSSMKNKYLILSVLLIIVSLLASTYFYCNVVLSPHLQDELDFVVTGTNSCLRFLTRTVQLAYIPFTTGANEKWQLSIECTQMSSAAGWTEIYMYKDYWDEGNENMCMSENLYPIIDKIETTEFQVKTNSTFTQTFGESIERSYTIFFLMPPGGNGTYQIKLTKIT